MAACQRWRLSAPNADRLDIREPTRTKARPTAYAKVFLLLGQDTYVIPKGTRIAGNHWAIHRDPEVFPNPEVFDLNRWLVKQDDGRVSLNSNLKHFQFG